MTLSVVLTMLLATLKGIVYGEGNEPIPDAYVSVVGSKKGAFTDSDGKFTLQDSISSSSKLSVEFAGYNSDTILIRDKRDFKFDLKPISLDAVTVSAKNGLLNMRTTTLQVQSIGTAELFRAACCNLSESFQTNASVDVSYSDAATGAKQIRLLGLSNQYVQMTVEKIPAFRGLAMPYGLSYIPSDLLSSIQISKGSGSVVDGYDAMSGQINIELKKPQNANRLSVSGFIDSKLMYQADAMVSHRFSDSTSTLLFAHYNGEIKCGDGNDDSFMDMPDTKQINIFNRWFAKRGIFRQQAGVKYIGERRKSGQMDDIPNPYKVSINTNRFEAFAKEGFIIDPKKNRSVGIILSASYHDMESNYGLIPYDANELNTYLNAIYQSDLNKKLELKCGLNGVIDNLDENIATSETNTNERSVGVFSEFTFKPTKRISLILGLREDYINTDSWFTTPRLHLMYSPTEDIQIRGALSYGSRTPHLYAENPSLLITSRQIIVAEDLKREKSWNYGVSAQWANDNSKYNPSISAEWYYTNFNEQMLIDYNVDPHLILVSNLNGRRSFSNTAQIEASIMLFRGFTLTGAYRHTTVKQPLYNENGNGKLVQKPLTGRNKVVATAGYETKLKKWQFDLTAQCNGKGNMPKPDDENPLWKTSYNAFTLFNAQVTRHFKYLDIFVGCENIGNFKQKNPIISAKEPWSENFDGTMIYGPIEGRKFYATVKYRIDYK